MYHSHSLIGGLSCLLLLPLLVFTAPVAAERGDWDGSRYESRDRGMRHDNTPRHSTRNYSRLPRERQDVRSARGELNARGESSRERGERHNNDVRERATHSDRRESNPRRDHAQQGRAVSEHRPREHRQERHERRDDTRRQHHRDGGWQRIPIDEVAPAHGERLQRKNKHRRDADDDRKHQRQPRHELIRPPAVTSGAEARREHKRHARDHKENALHDPVRHIADGFRYRPRAQKHYRHSYHGRPNYRLHHRHRYVYYRNPWYSTRFLAPIHVHYHPIGYRVRYLPRQYLRIVISSIPYLYLSGVFYQSIDNGYVVVNAPHGAVISELPVGYIAFNNGFDTYFYVNATYYRWSDSDAGFVVVSKPDNADSAIEEATRERLYAYPNAEQSEEQQAKDRYECHQWAVSEANVDPTLEDANETLSLDDVMNYRRALSACLEGRDYTVE